MTPQEYYAQPLSAGMTTAIPANVDIIERVAIVLHDTREGPVPEDAVFTSIESRVGQWAMRDARALVANFDIHTKGGSIPQRLRDAAHLVNVQFDRLRSGDRAVSSILREEAERLEHEQAEKVRRDKVAQFIAEAVDNVQFKLDAYELEQVTEAIMTDPRLTITQSEEV